MTRVLSLAGFVALVAALLLLPNPHPARLGAFQAGTLLGEPVTEGEGAAPPGEQRQGEQEALPLWKALLKSTACSARNDGVIVLRIGTSRVEVEGQEVEDRELGDEAKRSIVRAMRAVAADDSNGADIRAILAIPEGQDVTLEIDQVTTFAPARADFLTRVGEGSLEVGFRVLGREASRAERQWSAPSRTSLYPPLLAILLAILLRRPVVALLSGVALGAVLVQLAQGASLGEGVAKGAIRVVDLYFWTQFTRRDRVEIVLFVVFMLAMVGVITRAGGIRGVMDGIAKLASSVRRTQIATYLMGLVIFFDDYANTILVGSTMRPLTDKFKIAREKLAYIVDSTAAPVAGISIFSTWIAFEVSTFSAQLPDAELAPGDGYAVFMQTLPYRFYSLFTLLLVALITITGRDFGPMRAAESRARAGKVLRDGAKPMVGKAATELQHNPQVIPAARAALVPVLTFVAVTLFSILYGGGAFGMGARLFSLEGMAEVLYAGSGSAPLMYGALAGLSMAALMAYMAGLSWDIFQAAWTTLRSMGIALVILYLAWMIGQVCDADNLGTAAYLSVLLQEHLPALALPAILFILAGLVAFSTGSSWSTMTILLPLVVGLSFSLGETTMLGGHTLMVISIGAVLEGAIFGDHCSPISDTTILSSIASASDHIDHVRTQVPYALTAMGVALVLGYFPTAFLGLSPFISLVLGAAALVGIVFYWGRPADVADASAGAGTDDGAEAGAKAAAKTP